VQNSLFDLIQGLFFNPVAFHAFGNNHGLEMELSGPMAFHAF
jgi:hypothetical protein